MKKLLCVLPILLFLSQQTSAQLLWGIKGGVSTTQVSVDDLNILENGTERLRLALDEAEYGVHGGLVFQAHFNHFIIQPEFLLNSNRVNYRLTDLKSTRPDTLISEKYQYLDLPLLLGAKLGPVRVLAGPEAHVYLSSTSLDIEGYTQDFQDFSVSWMAGVGVDIWSLLIDLRYEGNFTKFGDHFVFFGNQYEFNNAPSRLLLSVSILFNRKKLEQ